MKERLQKVIAHAGITSRRKAEHLIQQGRVTVNGKKVTETVVRVDPQEDHIKVDGKLIRKEEPSYYALHKPVGVLSSVSDPQDRPVVTDFVPAGKRLYPAGRLDASSEGLVLLTNDGELTARITRAGKIAKTYRVKVRGCLDSRDLDQLKAGLTIDDQLMRMASVRPIKRSSNCWYEMVLRQGRNRQIRRMLEAIDHPVMRLKRTAIGPVKLANLRPGQWRRLTRFEIEQLKKA